MLKFFLLNIFLLINLASVFIFYNLFLSENIFFYFINNYILIDVFSLILLITTSTTLIISLIIVDNKYFYKNKKLFLLFNLFLITILGLVLSNNIFSFFIFYELLLIPAYVLVLKSSPNRRSKIISNYFLLWTQFGSFLVLLGLFSHYNIFLNKNFFNFNKQNLFLFTQLSIFLGFGIKIPLWPFHFWLSKTHVEANTGFSIFLSGILVKAALMGLYKFICLFLYKNSWIFLSFCFISLIDASLKMCIQNDLKKLVAYATIQEMALITLLLLFFSKKNNYIFYIFIIFHTFISALFFWIVDCINRRFNSRVVYNIQGLSNITPQLSSLIITSVYLFMGLPFTIKFSIEVFILKILLNFNIIIFTFVGFFINYLCMLFFFKIYIFINFGNNIIFKQIDLSKKEFMLILFLIFGILLLNFL